MIFDWTITLGNVVTVLGFAGSGIIFVMMMRSDIRILTYRISAVETTLQNLAVTSMGLARLEGRMATLESRVSMLVTKDGRT